MLLVIALLVFSIAAQNVTDYLGKNSSVVSPSNITACLGAPYFYVSFHGNPSGPDVVYKYSRDGCFLGLALDLSQLTGQFSEPRDMLLVGDILLVTNADSTQSKVWKFGNCDANGVRPYSGVFVDMLNYPGLSHPYGISIDSNGSIYVSSQHTDNVLRWYGLNSSSPGQAIPFPDYISVTPPPIGEQWYTGTFVQFGDPVVHDSTQQGARAIAFDNQRRLWVNNEDLAYTSIYDSGGYVVGKVPINDGIGMYYDAASNIMYIGSNADDCVYSINPVTLQVIRKFSTKGMSHPAGMLVYSSVLYVLDQGAESLFAFDVSSGSLLSTIISGFTDDPEGILLSPC